MEKLGIRHLLGYIVSLFIFTIVGSLLISQFTLTNTELNYVGICFIQVILDIIALYVFTKIFIKKPLSELLGVKPNTLFNNIVIGILAYLGVKIFLTVLVFFIGDPQRGVPLAKLYNMDYFKLMCQAVIIAPLREELIFRGLLQPIIKNKFGVIASIILTTLIFTFIHTSYIGVPLVYIVIFTIALIMSILRHKTNSIVPSYIVHLMFNLHI